MKKEKEIYLPSITICIIMDLLGMVTYVLPWLGEFADLVWAPISGFIFFLLFGGRFGVIK